MATLRDQYGQTVDEVVEQIQAGINDAKGDHPDVGEDDIAYELTNNMTYGAPAAFKREVRGRMGF